MPRNPSPGSLPARFSTRCGLLFLCAAAGLALAPAPLAGQVRPAHATYRLVDLGVLPGMRSSRATAINNRSQVVGVSSRPRTASRAFLFEDLDRNHRVDPGEMIDLGTLGGRHSEANALNNAGVVVGSSTYGNYRRAFRWEDKNGNGTSDPGEMESLYGLGGDVDEATGINDAGYICGVSEDQNGYSRAVYWDPQGNVYDLGTLGGDHSRANGINQSGEICGWAEDAQGNRRPFLYRNQQLRALPTPTRQGGEATALNDLGNVTGWVAPRGGGVQAFFWQPAERSAITPSRRSTGRALNRAEFIVGDANGKALIWDADEGPFNLNQFVRNRRGWTLKKALGISDAGQIVGFGAFRKKRRAFLLVPSGG